MTSKIDAAAAAPCAPRAQRLAARGASKIRNAYLIKVLSETETQVKALKEQLDMNQQWFTEINVLCGCPEEDPAVESVKKLKETNLKYVDWLCSFADFFDHDENHKEIYQNITGLTVEDDFD